MECTPRPSLPPSNNTQTPFASQDNNNDNDNNDHNTDAAPNEQEHDIKTQKQVAWRPTPPANVAYHDYAWWHEKEVCSFFFF